MALPDGLPDAMVPAARRFQLPDRLQADAPLLAQPWSDAWDAVHPDEVEDVPVLARADAQCVEKSVAPALVGRARAAVRYLPPTLPAQAVGPCKPDAVQFAA
jgi:hypothetical protein